MLLQHSRRDARTRDGRLVLLADQDRTRWHHDEVAEAMRLLAAPALTGPLTPLAASYALQARIAAEHATAPTTADTRWDRVVGLYDLLLQVAPSPSARLARAVAVAEDRGAAAGLAALEGLEIPSSHRPAAVRAELLARSGDTDAARAAYDQAIAACRNDVERAFLVEQRESLG
jgi:RNA polymerase sigma-70 factor (ECF subfamily)